MRKTLCSLVLGGLLCGAVCDLESSAFGQRPEGAEPGASAITLRKEVNGLNAVTRQASAAGKNGAAFGPQAGYRENYRELEGTKVGERSGEKVLTLDFHGSTRLSAIAASGDFEVAGGNCAAGRMYGAGDSCTVEVVFRPTGVGHRTGVLTVSHSAAIKPMLTPIGGTGYGSAVQFVPSLMATLPGTLVNSAGTLLGVGQLAVDGGDSLYIADAGNNVIKKVDSSGAIATIVGGGSTSPVSSIGFGTDLKLNQPYGVTVTYDNEVFISDTGDLAMLLYFADTETVKDIGNGATPGVSCSYGSQCALGTVALQPPTSLASDPSGSVYMAETYGNGFPGSVLAELTVHSSDKYFELGGTEYNYYSDSNAISVDPYGEGNLYYTYLDPGNGLLSPSPLCYVLGQNSAYSDGLAGNRFWTVAGSGPCGYSGDGVKATSAEISGAIGQFAWDVYGNFYFTDTGNNRVRRVDGATGVIHTIAGNGKTGYGGDGGPSTSATIQAPVGLAVDSTGQVYVTGTTASGTAPLKADIRKFGTIGALSFGQVGTGTHSPTQTVLVSNVGNSTLNFAHAAFSSGNATDFAIDPITTTCAFPGTLAEGANCYVGIIFTPTTAGARSAVLTIGDDTPSGENTIQVSGSGATSATLTPGALTFASTTVGATSAAQTITLANTGSSALTITSLGLSGSYATSFTETTNCGTTLAAAASCTVTIAFKPQAAGSLTASLVVNDNAGSGQQSATLTGAGVAAAAKGVVSPSSLTFASTTVGTSSAAQTITLSNTGGAALSITSVTVAGTFPGDFPMTKTCGTTLASGSTCTATVTFKPTNGGGRSAFVSFVTGSGTLNVAMNGTGAAAAAKAALSPTPLLFSAQTVSTESVARSFVLKNTGGSTLTIGSYALTGAEAADFVQTHNCGAALGAGGSCTVSVVFRPKAAGTRTATLTVGTSAGVVSAGVSGMATTVKASGVAPGPVARKL